MKKIAVVLIFLLYTPHFFSQGTDTAHYPQFWIHGGVALGFFSWNAGTRVDMGNLYVSARYKYWASFVMDQRTPIYKGVDLQIGKAFDLGRFVTFTASCGIEHFTYGKDIFDDNNPWGYYRVTEENVFIAEAALMGRISRYFGISLNCGKTFGADTKIIIIGLNLFGRLPI